MWEGNECGKMREVDENGRGERFKEKERCLKETVRNDIAFGGFSLSHLPQSERLVKCRRKREHTEHSLKKRFRSYSDSVRITFGVKRGKGTSRS